jgi:hypothetical protein
LPGKNAPLAERLFQGFVQSGAETLIATFPPGYFQDFDDGYRLTLSVSGISDFGSSIAGHFPFVITGGVDGEEFPRGALVFTNEDYSIIAGCAAFVSALCPDAEAARNEFAEYTSDSHWGRMAPRNDPRSVDAAVRASPHLKTTVASSSQ